MSVSDQASAETPWITQHVSKLNILWFLKKYRSFLKSCEHANQCYNSGETEEVNIFLERRQSKWNENEHEIASDNIRGGSISTTQYCTIPQASLHQKKSLWLSH